MKMTITYQVHGHMSLLGFTWRVAKMPLPSSVSFSTKPAQVSNRSLKVKSFFNPENDPILRDAIKEPVAFLGGVFAGVLRLDLNEEPLKDWIGRTVEASGVTEEDIEVKTSEGEAEPQQIEIE